MIILPLCIVYGKTFSLSTVLVQDINLRIWNNLPVWGERYENPCEAKAKMIVIAEWSAGCEQMAQLQGKHYRIYRIREEPPKIIYVGIQANADRTHGKVEAWYSDICLNK